MMRSLCSSLLLTLAVLVHESSAQQPQQATVIQGDEWVLSSAHSQLDDSGDFREILFGGGFRFRWPRLHVSSSATRAWSCSTATPCSA